MDAAGAGAMGLAEATLRRCLADFDRVVLSVSGHCMAPAIAPGDRAVIVGRHSRRPRFGDVVLVRLPAGLRLHRLVWSPPLVGRWRTKGDGGPLWDPAVPRADVLGTVVEMDARALPAAPSGAALRSLASALRFRLRRAAGLA